MRAGRAEKPEYTDRGPVHQALNYAADGVLAHDWTTRASYTVPTGKLARILAASLTIVLEESAAMPGSVEAVFRSTSATWLSVLNRFTAQPAQIAQLAIGESGEGLAGEVFTIQTRDQSGDGIAAYRLNASLMEYNS